MPGEVELMNKEADQRNSLPSSGWLEADTGRSSDQKTPTDNTSECSTETKGSIGENVNDGGVIV
ncbi:MAG: hypothetical protein LBH78_03055 [Rickettsiales bacterium]|jgi:hypothetical protein|nr:hypothetical protein [Rickettsiales bacterium]